MTTIAPWRVAGDWFDICSCRIPCPCTFAQPPTYDTCDAILAWKIREGHYGDTRLDGLKIVTLGSQAGDIWGGNGETTIGFFMDDRADGAQREALRTIFTGKGGGWPGEFGETFVEIRGIEFVPIEIELADDLTSWSVEVPGFAAGHVEALTGPTADPDRRVQLHNAPGAEVGPGQIATWGKTSSNRADGYGFKWETSGLSSKHFPFDWQGP
jgi:hypothetical protein